MSEEELLHDDEFMRELESLDSKDHTSPSIEKKDIPPEMYKQLLAECQSLVNEVFPKIQKRSSCWTREESDKIEALAEGWNLKISKAEALRNIADLATLLAVRRRLFDKQGPNLASHAKLMNTFLDIKPRVEVLNREESRRDLTNLAWKLASRLQQHDHDFGIEGVEEKISFVRSLLDCE